MKKICFLFAFFLISCAHEVGIDNAARYQCGEQIVDLVFSDDETIVINIGGQNYVLNQINTSVGEQYMNEEETVSVLTYGDDVYVTVNGSRSPLCYKITQ